LVVLIVLVRYSSVKGKNWLLKKEKGKTNKGKEEEAIAKEEEEDKDKEYIPKIL